MTRNTTKMDDWCLVNRYGRKTVRCKFCGLPDVHDCPGGRHYRRGGMFGLSCEEDVFPGLVDAASYPLEPFTAPQSGPMPPWDEPCE